MATAPDEPSDAERRLQRHTGFLEEEQYADERGQTRLERQLARVPAMLTALDHKRLALELALKAETPMETFERYGMDEDAAVALLQDREFAAMLDTATQEVQKQGLGFQKKAAFIAEGMLPYLYAKGTDPETSPKDVKDITETAARLGRLEPPKVTTDAGGASTGASLNLTIQFTGAPAEKVVANAVPVPRVFENGE